MKQYVYKLSLKEQSSPVTSTTEDAQFYLIFNSLDLMKKLSLFIKRFGFSNALLKLFIKLTLKKNAFYFLVYRDTIVNDGLISFNFCRHYQIGKHDCVIGPVNTDPNFQGKGFATLGLLYCIERLKLASIYEHLFIDTKENNLAMQKVIKRCGFGEHIETFERDNSYY